LDRRRESLFPTEDSSGLAAGGTLCQPRQFWGRSIRRLSGPWFHCLDWRWKRVGGWCKGDGGDLLFHPWPVLCARGQNEKTYLGWERGWQTRHRRPEKIKSHSLVSRGFTGSFTAEVLGVGDKEADLMWMMAGEDRSWCSLGTCCVSCWQGGSRRDREDRGWKPVLGKQFETLS
jgi:hypothetical protein